ncbi:MAG: InlB B-repeat-containing protein [Muribaculaceae bacterium]|nr:InlB B-repeat-containing protein [Muribaculaceae bacterium]
MTNKFFGTKLIATALATFALASCQSESSLVEPSIDNMRDVNLTITASKGDFQTRTNLDLSEDQKKLLLTWNLGDVIHVSENNGKYAGILTVTEFVDDKHTKAKFEGNIRVLDQDGKHTLTFASLGKDVEYSANRGRQMTNMSYEFSSQINAGVGALAANDLLIADGDVNIYKGEATFNDLYMKRQFAFGRFTLLYNGEPLVFDANTVVTINTEKGDIKTGATLAFPKAITPNGETSISLTTSENDFYVTFVPDSKESRVESKIKFSVTVNGETYEGYSNSYLIEENDFYRKAQGLEKGEALPINVKNVDEQTFELTYNQNFGPNDTWTDTQTGIRSYTFKVSDYVRFDDTNEGYDFIGWNTVADGSGDSYAVGSEYVLTSPTKTATLYAQWSKKDIIYKVNYEVGDEITTKEIPSKDDEIKVNVNEGAPTVTAPAGYEFVGWAKKGEGETETDVVSEVTLTKDNKEVTVVPVFSKKPTIETPGYGHGEFN